MSEADRIADELARAFDGDPWHGDPLMELLGGVSAEEASARPIPGAHSIWELALHLRAWMQMGTRRLEARAPLAMDPADDWPAVPSPADEPAWAAALAGLHEAQRALLAAVATLDDGALHAPLGPRDRAQGTGGTCAFLLYGLAQHAAYHAGQIALLKRALRG